jgi:hypothetical protein
VKRPDEVVMLDWGRCGTDDDKVLRCFACGGEARPWAWSDSRTGWGYGFVIINDDEPRPICEACFCTKNAGEAIVRRYCGDADIEIRDLGKLPDDVLEAMMEKAGKNTH